MFIMLMLTLFLFKLTNLKFINQFKYINYNFILSFIFIIIILTMSGIPPFSGFTGKFIMFISIFENSQKFYIIILLVLNFNSLYFYIQNTRFVINNKSTSIKFKYNKYNLKKNDLILLNLLILININYININSILDIIIYLYSIISDIYI
jgi:NADH:ubiquinone oxidoreductase subunit 2 (subunit N)